MIRFHYPTAGVGNCLVAIGVILLSACAPPPLTDQVDGDTTNGQDAGDIRLDAGDVGSDSMDLGDVGPPPAFSEIAAIIRTNCAESGCHADPGQGGFGIEGGSNASDTQIRAALEDVTLRGEQTALVAPGMPAASAIYQVLIPLEGRTQMPFERDPLPDEQISMIRRWIEAGADYE